ncbi:MAG TPA: HAMP domain-containing sensor histidine kinase [Gemmatimonadaceae bacterium]|jgi:signal transduction histidine kinase
MKVATRLRGAFAIYIALLALVALYHMRTIQRAVASGHALSELSSRLRVASTTQVDRIAQMNSDAEKFLVTRDGGYLRKVLETSRAYGRDLAMFDSLSLTPTERKALQPLSADWRVAASKLAKLGGIVTSASPASAEATVAQLQQDLARIRAETESLAAASQDAMTRELADSEAAASAAERVSWVAAIGALALSILLSALLARSIITPLRRLAEGTREVSAGRFGHRLDVRGEGEFAQVSHDFNSMIARLDEVDRMKREFAEKVSHDLKTPLSSMQETIRAVADGLAGPVTPKQQQLLEMNIESGQRLSAMLTKLLDLSRIEAGLEPDFQMVDLIALVRRSVDRAGALPSPRSVALRFAEPAQRVLVRADAEGIAQVVDNLLENAIKFSPSDSTVEVHLTQALSAAEQQAAAKQGVTDRVRGRAVVVTVADEGAGIPDDEKERVFERFYQTEAGRAARGRGVGLGLTICREIVTSHGGALWASDNEPRGTVFHMLLPGAVNGSTARNRDGADVGNDAHREAAV